MKHNPLKAIRKNCIECSGNSLKEVSNCPMENCSLFPFRFGKNPNRRGMGNLKKLVKSGSVAISSVANQNLQRKKATGQPTNSKRMNFIDRDQPVNNNSKGGA